MVKRSPAAPKNAQQSAFRLLAIRDHSCEELRRKLVERNFSAGEIEEVLRSLEAGGFLDDARYADRLARSLAESRLFGARQIRQKLFRKGIPTQLIEQALQTAEEALSSEDRLQRLLKSKLKNRDPEQLPPKEKQKLANTLHQRGFLWEQIAGALSESGGYGENEDGE
jgi:regulatory protein